MSEIGEYLLAEYYPHYTGDRTDVVPDNETLEKGLANHPDKVIVIRDEKIRGVAIFVTISDETYGKMKDLDMTQVDVIKGLFNEHGPNIHFILIAANGIKTILMGINEIKRRIHPKTISWWDPNLRILHKYKVRE